MPKSNMPKPGQIFVVPLLGGGYAFGYPTVLRGGGSPFCNILDHVADDDVPTPALLKSKVLLHDLQAGGEFHLSPGSKAGERWRLTDVFIDPPPPKNRYIQMGLPPRAIDLLGKEKDRPLSPEEAKHVPKLSKPLPPYPTAVIEVAVKRLDCTPDDLLDEWEAGRLATAPGKPAKSPRASAKRAQKPNPAVKQIHIQVRTKTKGLPSTPDLELRHQIEDLIAKRKLGTVTDAGGGQGVMDIFVKPKPVDALERIVALLEELGLGKRRATAKLVDV